MSCTLKYHCLLMAATSLDGSLATRGSRTLFQPTDSASSFLTAPDDAEAAEIAVTAPSNSRPLTAGKAHPGPHFVRSSSRSRQEKKTRISILFFKGKNQSSSDVTSFGDPGKWAQGIQGGFQAQIQGLSILSRFSTKGMGNCPLSPSLRGGWWVRERSGWWP